MNQGISICIVNYNTYFYIRLAVEKIREHTHLVPYEILIYDNGSTDGSVEWLEKQSDVKLFRGQNNSMRHGRALDYLIKQAQYNISCTLCSDAHPISDEWIFPAFKLYQGDILLSGIEKNWGRIIKQYVCPSYLFGKTEWLVQYSFCDNWPHWDTGENLSKEVVFQGKKICFIDRIKEDFGGRFRPKDCNYGNLIWHVWWSSRRKVVGLIQSECEEGYHDFMIDYLRNKYNLEY